MDQNKDGKKIQNWHKPLHEKALKNKFLRRRHLDPGLELPQEIALPSGQLVQTRSGDVDACWNYRDPAGFGWEDENVFEGNYSYFLRMVFKDLQKPLNNPFRPLLANLESTTKPQTKNIEDGIIELSETPLAERLREFIDVIEEIPKTLDTFRNSIQERIQDTESIARLRIAAESLDRLLELDFRLMLFSEFWIRTPKSWNGEGGWQGLVRHLFVKYEPPKFLYKEWCVDNFPRYKWIVWFLLYAQGGSLKNAASLFGWNIANGFPAQLYQVPENRSPVQACICAEILRFGGSESTFNLLDETFTIDPTESRNPSFISFWRETVRWLIKYSDDIQQLRQAEGMQGIYVSRMILYWAMHKYTETERGNGASFSWRGRRIRSTFDQSLEYWRSFDNSSRMNFAWASHGWDWSTIDERDTAWSIIELTSTQCLVEEGKKMHHCVGGYTSHCLSGNSSIFSLRFGEISKVTIELDPHRKNIIQARGNCNQAITRGEHEVISNWLKEVVRARPIKHDESI